MSSPAVALARALIDEAVACGVREVVLCPGSRSAPLAYAALAAADAGHLRLHVRVDERSAAFLALGLAKTSRRPPLVVTTSGTAVANLHPAVLEAHHAGVPLIVVSADRPRDLRHSGANQTTVQPGMFGAAVRWEADIDAPGEGSYLAEIRGVVRSAYAACAPPGGGGDPGPVHLNVCLREPLVPDGWPLPGPEVGPAVAASGREDEPAVVASGREDEPAVAASGDPTSMVPDAGRGPADRPAGVLGDLSRTLVVLGDLVDPATRPVVSDFARRHGYPLLAEPFGRLLADDAALPHGPLLLSVPGWLDAHAPDRVLVVGRPTLSRAVLALLRRPGLVVEAVTDRRLVADPAGVVRSAHPFSALSDTDGWPGVDPAWASAWHAAGTRLAGLVAADPPPWGSGLAAARTVLAGLPPGAHLFLGSSNAVRDVDLTLAAPATAFRPDAAVSSAPRQPSAANRDLPLRTLTIVASRGLAGIDGCVATSAGIALAEGSAYALMGDLTFLHDANALLIGPGEPRPDLTIVVINDDGGGIFTLLEPGEPARAGAFDRLFATPTGTDLAGLCAAHGVDHLRVTTAQALTQALATYADGIRIIEVPTSRARHRADHAALRAVAARL